MSQSDHYIRRIELLIDEGIIPMPKDKSAISLSTKRITANFLATHLYNRTAADVTFRGEAGRKIKHFILTGQYLECIQEGAE